ncbi:MAG: aminotransferase class V-fold PLP-dependent enzyme [Actinobacteria bacterium]|nr:aminotransferase class V-fold PLP-dependent enzyme [Actinomycetota bacterium]
MQVPFLDLKAQYAGIREEVRTEVNDVLDSQICIGGAKVEELEQAIAKYCGCGYAVGASSGTDAILNALMSLEIGPGDEVITTPFTFFATAGCIARVGARAVFVDIKPGTYNIDTDKIGRAITKKTKAILPVHLFGQTADMDPIVDIAKKANLVVIEDAAQSIGANYKGRRAGTMGTCGCLSFYPSKNLGAAGDAGMILSNDAELAKKIRMMRNHGDESTYQHRLIGGNFRLDAIQAAVLLAKLPLLDKWTSERQKIAAYYNEAFAHCSKITTPAVSKEKTCVYNYYVIRVPRRDEVAKYLRQKQIGCSIYYPLPLHMQECFSDWGYSQDDFPESEKAAEQVLALPIYPELTAEQKDCVITAVLGAVED